MLAATAPTEPSFLYGVLQIGGQRNFTITLNNEDIFLVCNTFWKEKTLFMSLSENGANFTEEFTIEHNNQFLEKVKDNCLSIELSKRGDKSTSKVIGCLRLPLHQFFIAYRDASLTNHLNDSQFPVISTNKWVSVLNSISGKEIGEIECFLAMGTEKQINNTKSLRTNSSITGNFESAAKDSLEKHSKNSRTSNLLTILKNSLSYTTPYMSHVQPELNLAESNTFRIVLEIKSARNLPITQSHKLKKKLNRSICTKGNQNLDQVGEQPSSYVTFQAKEGEGPMVKSHEGMVYSTMVIEKSSNPVWNMVFSLSESINLLINKNEWFILKVWKKVDKNQNLPCPIEDAIIGFVKIKLSDLVEKVPVLNDWFDVVDFSGHNNGQIHISCKPVDDIQKLKEFVRNNQVENLLNNFESSLDINNMSLCRAIKRKFTELEEISERLRTRLLDVTGSVDVCKIAKDINDEQLEEFEHDINTSVCEDENHGFDKQEL